MKRMLIIFWLVMFLVPAGSVPAEQTLDPRNMTFPALSFQVPAAERVVLANGMVVYLLEDHELPLVTMQAYIGAGSVYEPAEKAGLASLTGTVLRSGGTDVTPPELMDDELEFMASTIDTGIGADAATASLSCLKKNLVRTLGLFAQVLTVPAFREDRVQLAKNRAIDAILRQNDDPKEVADRELAKAIYRGHPLGRYPTVESVTAVTRDDLVAFHRRYFHPNNVILAVSGDFDRKDILEKIGMAFAAWKRQDVPLPVVADPVFGGKPEVLLIRKDIDQSVIRMGHLGIEKNNPDVYAVTVMNAILGGNGFSSRLMTVIRAQQGLAYNVDSSFQPGRRFPGVFQSETETKAHTTVKAISLMESIIADMTKRPVSEAELSLAKESIINSFVFAFTTPASVANLRARLEYYGYPQGYLENYRKNIARVTRADVLCVARKYLHPEKMILVVAGNEKKFDKPLATFGTVKEINQIIAK